MAQVLELKDGSLITPFGLFDMLDAVQEYMGTDARDYLESWFEEEPREPLGDEALRDHYITVLEIIDTQLSGLENRKKKEREDTQARVQMLLRREINGKEDV